MSRKLVWSDDRTVATFGEEYRTEDASGEISEVAFQDVRFEMHDVDEDDMRELAEEGRRPGYYTIFRDVCLAETDVGQEAGDGNWTCKPLMSRDPIAGPDLDDVMTRTAEFLLDRAVFGVVARA